MNDNDYSKIAVPTCECFLEVFLELEETQKEAEQSKFASRKEETKTSFRDGLNNKDNVDAAEATLPTL